jgi:hypothetical protein
MGWSDKLWPLCQWEDNSRSFLCGHPSLGAAEIKVECCEVEKLAICRNHQVDRLENSDLWKTVRIRSEMEDSDHLEV